MAAFGISAICNLDPGNDDHAICRSVALQWFSLNLSHLTQTGSGTFFSMKLDVHIGKKLSQPWFFIFGYNSYCIRVIICISFVKNSTKCDAYFRHMVFHKKIIKWQTCCHQTLHIIIKCACGNLSYRCSLSVCKCTVLMLPFWQTRKAFKQKLPSIETPWRHRDARSYLLVY